MSQFLGFSVLFGALLALVIATGQLLRSEKSKNYRLVAALLFTIALWQGHTGLLVSHFDSPLTDILSFLLLPASLAFLPLYYEYGMRILSHSYENRRSLPFALLLFGLGLIIEILGMLFFSKERLVEALFAFSGFSRVMTILLSFYLIWIATRLAMDKKVTNQREIRISIVVLTVTTILGTSVSFYAQVIGHLKSDLHACGALLVSIAIVILYFLNERNAAFLDLEHRLVRDRKPSIDSEQILKLEQILEKLLREEEIYRTEELNISQLTEAINLEGYKFQQKQISEYINTRYQKNFNAWINEFRIEEACRLLRDPKSESILNIAYSVGFNSKSSFNSIFKASLGMTPNEYREKFRH